MMKLDAEQVETVFKDCLFREDEIKVINDLDLKPDDPEIKQHLIAVAGVVSKAAFHPGRLESHRDEVEVMLGQLDDNFKAAVGGGWSFVNLPMDRHGRLWGEQSHGELLALLAIALGLGTWLPPISMKEIWSALPGGVPYFAILDGGEQDAN